jgi:UDP-N-acetylglucosamine diphosphorylase / glucose-1-phosphate thymidylyltransferase / UDP-N-acetylgalactosamine diphosphorylase / glucosamine-1-phosphate N-acetyltransferase / galactosamine-1-phosphate N-acetyltransferase
MEPTIKELFDPKNIIDEILFEDCEFPWQLLPKLHGYLETLAQGKKEGEIYGGAFVDKNVNIGRGTVVEPGAVIFGPTVIGENCVVRSGAYIRGDVLIGDNVVVGHCTELKNTIVFSHSQVAHFNYVGDSVLGFGSHLAAGAKLANTKLPIGEVVVKSDKKRYATGLKKFGAALGDGAEVGCNAVLNPGSVIGKRSVIYPLVSWRGILAHDSIAKSEKTVVKKI